MIHIPRSDVNSVNALHIAARKLHIEVETIDSDAGLHLFKHQGKRFFVRQHIPDLNSYVASRVINNKYLAKKILLKNNISVPSGVTFSNLHKVLLSLREGSIKYPLVVKPIEGSMGEAVTVDIRSEDWLGVAIQEVYKYNRRRWGRPGSFLVEQYIPGHDYRFLVLDGRVLTALMRKPAYVIGDGVRTIQQLIVEYNNQPGVAKDQPLCPIVIDYELHRNLVSQQLTLETVLPHAKQIFLRRNANVSTGGRSFECFDKAAPEYLKLAARIGEIFQLRFFAVDLIARDISLYEKFAVIEINDTPGFDIHEAPYRGKPFPVAEHIVRAMFRDTTGGRA
ncbi:MAG: hypothetical protein HZC01_04200 [Candidatus Kerfeldbacteria bacterium]|nr:hypothetical protein [Candidatus Kerfeldbacteria bacterium]